MRLDLPGGEPLGIKRDHVARQPVEAAFVLGHCHRLKRARPVARHPKIDLADLGGDPLGRRAVAGVARPSALQSVALIAQMVCHLDLKPGLKHLAHQPRQQAAVAGQLHTLGAGTLNQKLGPVLHRRLISGLIRRHRRHILISHRHDPSRPATPDRRPSEHARYTTFPSVIVVVAGALGLGVMVRSCARR